MANKKHVALIKQGVDAWNKWRRAHPKVRPDLLGAPLFGANLCGADLREADLRGADLGYANLCGADLSYANLRGADLFWAILSEANLTKANLGYANLRGTDLSTRDLTPSGLAPRDKAAGSGEADRVFRSMSPPLPIDVGKGWRIAGWAGVISPSRTGLVKR